MNKYVSAIQQLDLPTVKTLVEAKPEWLTWSEPSGKNALHYLCGVRVGDDVERAKVSLALLKFLVSRGMDINSVHRIEEKGCGYFPATPLWYAYTRGRNEKVYRYLLRKGADPNNCMWAIAWYDDIKAAKLFIKHGARLDRDPSVNDLFLGSFGWKKFAFAYWLLTAGADVNAADAKGDTALIVAVKRKDEDNVRRLVKLGADPNRANAQGLSARTIAQAKGPRRLLDLLQI